MAVIASLAASLTVRTGKFEKGMSRASRTLRRFAGAAAQAFGVAGAGAGFISLGRSAERFNEAILQSQAIMGDLTDAIKTDMTQTAIDVARVTKFSAAETAKAYFFLASAGLDAAQSIKSLGVVARFAQAGTFDMALATDLLTDAQSALGLKVADATQNMLNMTRVSDVLVAANTKANASVQLLSEALTNKAAASAVFLGISLEDTVATLQAFADKGRKGAEAGTLFDIATRELTRRARENAEAFKRFNIRVVDSNNNFRAMADIIGDLENAFVGMTGPQKSAAFAMLGFQLKSSSALKVLLGTSDAIRQYKSDLMDTTGFTRDVAGKQLTEFAKSWAQVTASITQLGQAAAPVFSLFSDFLTGSALLIDRFVRGTEKISNFFSGKGFTSSRGDPFSTAGIRAPQLSQNFSSGSGGGGSWGPALLQETKALRNDLAADRRL